MRFREICGSFAGEWSRDCELLFLSNDKKGLTICYHKDHDNTRWKLECRSVVAYKLTSEEFSMIGYIIELPIKGAFFEVLDSSWISEYGKSKENILSKCKHYILRFYDETIEIIAQDFDFISLLNEESI